MRSKRNKTNRGLPYLSVDPCGACFILDKSEPAPMPEEYPTMERAQKESTVIIRKQRSSSDEDVLYQFLNSAGKLLHLYRNSTLSDHVYMSDQEAANHMKWDIKKLERIKAILRKLGKITKCSWDREVKRYVFYLKV